MGLLMAGCQQKAAEETTAPAGEESGYGTVEQPAGGYGEEAAETKEGAEEGKSPEETGGYGQSGGYGGVQSESGGYGTNDTGGYGGESGGYK